MTLAQAAALLSVVAVAVTVAGLHAVQDPAPSYKASPFLRVDPDKIVIANSQGFQPCGECHTPEWDVWKETNHAKGFETMHKSDAAQTILTNMEMSVTKRQEAVCMRCHYSVGPERKAVAGVSCESCHGPARDWISVHNTWGDGAADRERETPEGRARRVAASRAAGMLRPSTDIYGVAANCFECHTVPMEDLVNRGGHIAGTSPFDLVKRVNSIRHNFIAAGRSDPTNRPIAAERARVMFVVGRMLAYEYSLRGLAAATTAGPYSSSMATRAKTALHQLSELTRVASIPSVTEALKAGAKLKLVPNNRAELEQAANVIRLIGENFVATNTGSALAALDPGIAGKPLRSAVAAEEPDPSRSEPPSTPVAGAAAAPSPTTPGAPSAPTVTGTTPAPRGGAAVPAVAAAAPAARPTLPGRVRTRPAWHLPEGRSGMTGGTTCSTGTCHGDAATALEGGPHKNVTLRLTGENTRARAIAGLYGIGAGARADPGQMCMSCHATVDEANETPQDDGVSCEACHGAAQEWIKSHRTAGGGGGNPQPGMRALKTASVRAKVCADCHRITDERLLSAGHPDGTKKDIVAGLTKLKHWPSGRVETARKRRGQTYTELSEGAFKAAYDAIAEGRRIPPHTVFTLPSARRATAVAPAAPVATADPAAVSSDETPRNPPATAAVTPMLGAVDALIAPSRAAQPRPSRGGQTSVPPRVPTALPRRATGDNVSLDLEPIPPTDRLTTEELLLLVKERVARVHASIRRANQQP